MPNIIEQQDLLKGLPDNRLALLLRNPDATIPPFLVAAEAQRRQAIRQQFAGDAGKESVVDSLTKQLANVPQNVQAPMQIPPRMPAPMMPQAGIAALQQAPAQAPVQAPQQMAGGGPVRRYQVGSLVTPSASRVQEIADQFGYTVEQAAEALKNNPSLSGESAATPGLPFSIKETNQEARATSSIPDIPVLTRSPAEMAEINREKAREAKYQEMYNYGGYGSTSPSASVAGPTLEGITPDIPIKGGKKPVDPATGVGGTSAENKDKAESAKYRSMLEELYAVEEPSNWEEAQKWFAMSAQIMNPDANLMQGLVNAGAVYSQAEAEQAREQREADRELKKALLQYDIGERDYERGQASAARSERIDAMKYQADQARENAKILAEAARSDQAELRLVVSSLTQASIPPEEIAKDSRVIDLQERIRKSNERANNALIEARKFNTTLGNLYGFKPFTEASDGSGIYPLP